MVKTKWLSKNEWIEQQIALKNEYKASFPILEADFGISNGIHWKQSYRASPGAIDFIKRRLKKNCLLAEAVI